MKFLYLFGLFGFVGVLGYCFCAKKILLPASPGFLNLAACLLIMHHLFQGHWHFTSNTNVPIVQRDFCLYYLPFSYNPLAISQSKYQKHQIKRCKNVPVCSSIHDICCTTPFLLAWWWELQEELYESRNVACFEERDF